jgi:hypothetical protein
MDSTNLMIAANFCLIIYFIFGGIHWYTQITHFQMVSNLFGLASLVLNLWHRRREGQWPFEKKEDRGQETSLLDEKSVTM